MDFLNSLAAKGFTIIGVLTLVSIGISFVPGALGVGPALISILVLVTWALFIVGGYNEGFEFTEKELIAMTVVGIGIGIVGLGAFGFNLIPQFTAQLSQLGNVFSSGLLPVALGTAAGLLSNTILGSAKRFM